MHPHRKPDRLDGLLLLGLLLCIGAYAIKYQDFSKPPEEDAAMLMRYAQHLAHGDGIVWNIGEKPVDGATDFLFMVVVALLAKAGLSLEFAVRAIGFASHIATVILIYLTIRQLHHSPRLLALLSAAYLGIGPGLWYIAGYFGTTFFALFAGLTWYFAIRTVQDSRSRLSALLFGFSGLLTGLIRPEGVLLAIFMLIGIVFMQGIERSRRTVSLFVLIFAVLGGTYFLWRWRYFGYPLPNPYYVKGGGTLHLSEFKGIVQDSLGLILPFAGVFVLGFRSARLSRWTLFSLIPISGFVLIWLLLSSETNHMSRFQYAIVPLTLMSWTPILDNLRAEWKLPKLSDLDRRNRFVLSGLALVLIADVLLYQHRQTEAEPLSGDVRYDVAVALHAYSGHQYTIATTEAGLLPLYSNWRAIDAWGLNDPWIAHYGQITEAYLEQSRPEVIAFHAWGNPLSSPTAALLQRWSRMVATLSDYAQRRHYALAASFPFGSAPDDTMNFYVRPDFPDSAAIVRLLEQMAASSPPWWATPGSAARVRPAAP